MDKEIEAMAKISQTLSELDPEAIKRVLHYVSERFQVSISQSDTENSHESKIVEDLNKFDEFHELFDAANPITAPEKALVAAYWFQVTQSHEELGGFQLNKELKNLGHKSTNITRDLDSLINRTPRLLMQVRKVGSSKQARKRYKLTREGIRAVERMLGNGHE